MSEQASPRDLLFGDLPLAEWAQAGGSAQDSEPWASFVRANENVAKGDTQAAIDALQGIIEIPGLESRQYLEAWCALKHLGVEPPAGKAKDVLGVIVEVGLENGADIVAAYADHHARYYNFSGAAVIWEHPNDALDQGIDALLQAGEKVARAIGPWEHARPSIPGNGEVRLNMLTSSGLHFGQGPYGPLSGDPMGGPIISAAFNLMQEMMELTKRKDT